MILSNVLRNAIGAAGGLRDDDVDRERLALLFRTVPSGIVASVAVATVTVIGLWPFAGGAALLAWYLASLLLTASALVLSRRYARRVATAVAPRRHERAFAAGALARGALWGVVALLPGGSSFLPNLVEVFVVGGMAIGAVGVFGASPLTFAAFVAPLLLIPAAHFLSVRAPLYPVMGVLTLVLGVTLAFVYAGYYRTLLSSLRQRALAARLAAEQRALLDAAGAGIALAKDGRIVQSNRRLAAMLGREPDELAGWPLASLAADEAAWRGLWAGLVARGSVRAEVAMRRADGDRLWCDLSAGAIDPAHPEAGVVCVLADVTDRRRAERALRDSEERLELAIAASESGVWDWDIARGRTHCSPRFKAILGYPPDADFREVFSFAGRLHPEDRERVLAAEERAVSAFVPFDEEFRLRRADGEYVWVRGVGRAQPGPGGGALRFVGSLHDISERKRMEARLRASEAHFRRLVETSNDLIWEIDADARWRYVSPRAARQLFGLEPDALVGRAVTGMQPEDERARTEAMLGRVLGGEMVARFETAFLDGLGARVSVSLNATPVRDDAGRVCGASGTATDIGDRLRREAELAAALAEQELMFEAASEGIVFEQDGIVRKCNRMFASMLGYRPEDLPGQLTSVWFADPADFERTMIAAARRLRSGQVFERELRVARRDGEIFWCEVRGQAIRPGSLAGGIIWVYSDISERKAAEERIRHLANHDALTGLPNRRLLEDRLQQAIVQARRKQAAAAVMLVDLDGFKTVNDRFGHRMGDRVLVAVAARLRRCVRETDTVARMGGDEFVIVLSEQRSAADAATVAEKILGAMAEPVLVAEHRFELGASIGISLYPRDGTTAEELLRQADVAMYRVKEAGKNRYQFYRTGSSGAAD